jgi:hypothetical protein
MRERLVWSAPLLLVGICWFMGSAQAEPLSCERYCEVEAAAFLKTCGGKPDCSRAKDVGYGNCTHACGVDLTLIPEAVTRDVARETAQESFSGEWDVLDMVSFDNLGAPTSRVYTLARKDAHLGKASLDEALRRGVNPERFDSIVVGVETSANGSAPPVIAYWTGVSLEHVRGQEVQKVARDAGLEGSFKVVGRHGGSQFPVVTLEDEDGNAVSVDVRRARRADGAAGYPGYVPAAADTERSHQLRMLWFYELTRIAQEGGAR